MVWAVSIVDYFDDADYLYVAKYCSRECDYKYKKLVLKCLLSICSIFKFSFYLNGNSIPLLINAVWETSKKYR